MKHLFTKQFLITLVISFLVFEGVEHLVHELFHIDLEHTLALGGLGVWVVLGFKFHVLCCAIPALGSALYCTYKNHRHCRHNHSSDS